MNFGQNWSIFGSKNPPPELEDQIHPPGPPGKKSFSTPAYEAQRVIETQLIIFYEISMVTRELFDDFIYYLWNFSKRGYHDHRPSFGGKHLIFPGDFRQLPAIGNQYDSYVESLLYI